jgi:hypothetical protein
MLVRKDLVHRLQTREAMKVDELWYGKFMLHVIARLKQDIGAAAFASKARAKALKVLLAKN